MIRTTVRVEGLRELDRALKELPKSVARNTLRGVLKKRAKPLADAMVANAPDDPETGGNDLRSSIGVSTKLSRRQAKLHRREHRDDKAFAEVFVGAGPLPQAHLTEYGGPNNSPVGWGRAAWDVNKGDILDGIKTDLGQAIDKAATRLAKRRAKAAAKG